MADEQLNGGLHWRPAKPRQDTTTCSLCPVPQLTAYWTNPPSWPRRVICESKFSSFACSCFRDTRQAAIVLGGFLLTYICIMDLVLYYHFRKADLVKDSKGGRQDEIYTPFTHLSVKGLLNDQMSQYIVAASAEYFEIFIGLSKIFPFITPNVVTVAHLIVGFLAGKWMSSDNLYDRRIGVVMFEFRTWLDQYDGSVYRAQPENHLKYTSNIKSWGFWFDSTADSFGGAFLCISLYFYFMKRFRHSRIRCPSLPFLWSDNSQDVQKSEPLMIDGSKEYSPLYLFWKAFSYGLVLSLGGLFWGRVVIDFSYLFETPIVDPTYSALQYEMCHSYTTIIIFQMWRIIGSQCMLTYLLLLIFFDKTWEFLQGSQFVLFGMVVCLYLVTYLYKNHVQTELHL